LLENISVAKAMQIFSASSNKKIDSSKTTIMFIQLLTKQILLFFEIAAVPFPAGQNENKHSLGYGQIISIQLPMELERL